MLIGGKTKLFSVRIIDHFGNNAEIFVSDRTLDFQSFGGDKVVSLTAVPNMHGKFFFLSFIF